MGNFDIDKMDFLERIWVQHLQRISQPTPELLEEGSMKSFASTHRPSLISGVVLGILGACIVVFVTSAEARSIASAAMAVTLGGSVPQYEAPEYPVNDAGQTYGVAGEDTPIELEPDLLLVQAGNGAEGYVEKAVLDELTGANVSSPEEAVEWELGQDERASQGSVYIPVYENDGITQIGTFEVSFTSSTFVVDPDAEAETG